ncbi:MAG: hypothetical protein H0T62_13980 [Parachlamydiaceae bacterium]|nr:hypothetical protein [Parachlamydiaceae bacterium]
MTVSKSLINHALTHSLSADKQIKNNDIKGHYKLIKNDVKASGLNGLVGKLASEFESSMGGLNITDNNKLKSEINLLKRNISVISKYETPIFIQLFDYIFPSSGGALKGH